MIIFFFNVHKALWALIVFTVVSWIQKGRVMCFGMFLAGNDFKEGGYFNVWDVSNNDV